MKERTFVLPPGQRIGEGRDWRCGDDKKPSAPLVQGTFDVFKPKVRRPTRASSPGVLEPQARSARGARSMKLLK
jgi:hypothetical protein